MTGRQQNQASQQAVDRMPKAGEVIAERYRLVDQIATGGMGIIMRAEQLSMERDVAVKLLHPHMAEDPDTVRRFKREVRLAKQLAHPNVIQVFDVGRTDRDVLFLVMEYLDGQELKETLRRDAPLPVGRAVDIISQTLDGLAEAHDNGVIHRDLKPSNIFLLTKRRGDHVKLLDFGIAKSLESNNTALTKTGQLCGTANYMPPETFLQSSPGPAGDVYAAGLILLEMLTGRRSVAGDSMPETVMQHLKKPIELPEPIAESPLADIIKGATAKHPEDRFADADAMLDALERVEPELSKRYRLSTEDIPSSDSVDDLGKFSPDANLSMLRKNPSHEVGRQDSAPPETPSPESPSTGVSSRDLPEPNSELDEEATEFLRDLAEDGEAAPPRSGQQRSARPDTSPTAPGGSGADQQTSDGSVSAWINQHVPGGLTTLSVAAFLTVALAGGMGLYVMFSGPGESATASATTASSVEIRIETNPAGARVIKDGVAVGKTPIEQSVPKSDGSKSWTIKKSGYAPRKLDVTPDANRTFTLQLTEKPDSAPSESDGDRRDEVKVFKSENVRSQKKGQEERTHEPSKSGDSKAGSGEEPTEQASAREPDSAPEPDKSSSTASTASDESESSPTDQPASDPAPSETREPEPQPAQDSPSGSDDSSEDLDQLFEQHKLESD